jgi:hypothetical protein
VSDDERTEPLGPPAGWWDAQSDRAPLGIRRGGQVVVSHHRYSKFPAYHFDVGCDGLEGANWDLQQTRRFGSVTQMFESHHGRPCRRCALEPALIRYLRSPHTKGTSRTVVPGGRRIVTFSSQANPRERNASRFSYREVTDSGAERLRRVAAALRWPVTDTAAGPVTWARLHSRTGEALALNLRTLIAPDGIEMPDATTIEALWSLVVSAPPETGGWDDDVWHMAVAVAA